MNENYKELLTELRRLSGNGTKYQAEREMRYIGTTKTCLTISSPVIKQFVKTWLNSHMGLTLSEYADLLNSLYSGETHDERVVAGKLLEFKSKLRCKLNPKLLDSWLENAEGWSEVDSICQSNFTATELLNNWDLWRNLIIKFSFDKNIHKRRASLVLLTKPVRQSPDSRLSSLAFENIEKLKCEKDILITKAISWLLRDLIKNNKEKVQDYLNKNETSLPKIVVRETKTKLITGRKTKRV